MMQKSKQRKRIIYIAVLLVLPSLIWGALWTKKEIKFRNNGAINLDSANWQLVWSDEFDGDNLNLDYWSYDVGKGKWGNEEEEYYTKGENLSIEDGCLKITAKYNPENEANPYTSSRIITRGKVSFLYGKIEAKIKLPSGQGIWPAFWMMGNENPYPACGEIDIMEAINMCDIAHGNIHWGHKGENGKGINGYQIISDGGGESRIDNSDQWHTYSVMWSEEEIRWMLDGNAYYSFQIDEENEAQKAFKSPFYLLLNVAVGGKWTGKPDVSIFPQSMYVDYVRVYGASSSN